MRAFPSITGAGFLAVSRLAAIAATTGCGSDTSGSGGGGGTGGSAAVGGPVSGAQDAHCKATVTVDPTQCTSAGGAGGAGGMGGMGGMVEETHATLYNAKGDDDDCKYHLKWTSTDVVQNKDVTFTLELTTKADGKGAEGAAPDIEAFLDETHPAPNSDQKPTDKGGGKYDIGPLKFDAAGQWTIRFHLYEECMDSEASPHGHVGFYLNVP